LNLRPTGSKGPELFHWFQLTPRDSKTRVKPSLTEVPEVSQLHFFSFWKFLDSVHGHEHGQIADNSGVLIGGGNCDPFRNLSSMLDLGSIKRAIFFALVAVRRLVLKCQNGLYTSSHWQVSRGFGNKDQISRTVHRCGDHVSIPTPIPLTEISSLAKPQDSFIGVCNSIDAGDVPKGIQRLDDIRKFSPGKQYFAHRYPFRSDRAATILHSFPWEKPIRYGDTRKGYGLAQFKNSWLGLRVTNPPTYIRAEFLTL
jgi:hypothetical protein